MSQDNNEQIVSMYAPNSLHPYLDADPQQVVVDSSIELSDVNTHHFGLNVIATITLPRVSTLKSARVAWCNNALVHSIDKVTVTAPGMDGSWSITGRDIEDVIQWSRNDKISEKRWNEMLGNSPRLQTFTKQLNSYHHSFVLPLFFGDKYPLFLPDLSSQKTKIDIKLKKPRDLLRVQYKRGDITNLDYGQPALVDSMYSRFIRISGGIECRLSYRVTRCPSLMDYANRMYMSRYLSTYREFKSELDVINRDHKKELILDCNVTGFMWKLEAVYSAPGSNEVDIHTMGQYSLDPLNNSDVDPVHRTTIDLVYKDGTTKTWVLMDTESQQTSTEGVSCPFQVGYHGLFFDVDPFSGLKTEGLSLKSATFTCRSSDRSDSISGSGIADIDPDEYQIDDEDEGDEDEEVDDDSGIRRFANRARRAPDRRVANNSSRIVSTNDNGVKYRLIVRAIIVNKMNINPNKTVFKPLHG